MMIWQRMSMAIDSSWPSAGGTRKLLLLFLLVLLLAGSARFAVGFRRRRRRRRGLLGSITTRMATVARGLALGEDALAVGVAAAAECREFVDVLEAGVESFQSERGVGWKSGVGGIGVGVDVHPEVAVGADFSHDILRPVGVVRDAVREGDDVPLAAVVDEAVLVVERALGSLVHEVELDGYAGGYVVVVDRVHREALAFMEVEAAVAAAFFALPVHVVDAVLVRIARPEHLRDGHVAGAPVLADDPVRRPRLDLAFAAAERRELAMRTELFRWLAAGLTRALLPRFALQCFAACAALRTVTAVLALMLQSRIRPLFLDQEPHVLLDHVALGPQARDLVSVHAHRAQRRH
mmetsp:Transcript_11456/g.34267  ORF Transcript_11456/g.34267 Transcript_11456/m.34267 type:complete len:350 (-) Transcript_11456:261-1310(-)